jgi:hypothetical protein
MPWLRRHRRHFQLMGGWRFLAPMLFTVIVGQVLLVRGTLALPVRVSKPGRDTQVAANIVLGYWFLRPLDRERCRTDPESHRVRAQVDRQLEQERLLLPQCAGLARRRSVDCRAAAHCGLCDGVATRLQAAPPVWRPDPLGASLNRAPGTRSGLLESIVSASSAFFDVTPTGRVLNRFSKGACSRFPWAPSVPLRRYGLRRHGSARNADQRCGRRCVHCRQPARGRVRGALLPGAAPVCAGAVTITRLQIILAAMSVLYWRIHRIFMPAALQARAQRRPWRWRFMCRLSASSSNASPTCRTRRWCT